MVTMQRALVVGLGMDALPLLEQIDAQFRAAGKAGDCACLWLPPFPQTHDHCLVYSLSLNNEILKTLYYQRDVRNWSGPNWRKWGEAIASNRLSGKLAAYYHLPELFTKISEVANALSQGEVRKVQFYVLASLHDPFASGAVLDIAYLLHRIALSRGASVQGLLLLPGIINDPVVQPDTTVNDGELRRATCYAALRELNFVCGEKSFYNSYSRVLDNSASHRFQFQDVSPFQTGDCYLIGGESSGEGNSRYKALEYSTVKASIAHWLYLKTCTSLGAAIPRSDQGRSVFSTFGIATSIDYEHRSETAAQEANQIALQVIDKLLATRITDSRYPTLVRAAFNARYVDQSSTFDPAKIAQANAEAAISVTDERYLESVAQLQNLETLLAVEVSRNLEEVKAKLAQDIVELIRQPDMTVDYVEQTGAYNLRLVQEAYRTNQAQVEELEQEAARAMQRMRDARATYLYNATAPEPWLRRLLVATGSLSWIGAAVILINLGLPVLTCIGSILMLFLPVGTAGFFQRRHQNSRSGFDAAQRDLLSIQRQLITQRTTNAHLHDVWRSLEQEFTPNSISTAGRFRELLQEASRTLRTTTAPAEMMYDVQAVASHVFSHLWSQTSHLTSHDIIHYITETIHQHQMLNQTVSASETLQKLTRTLYEQMDMMLGVKSAYIDHGDHERVTRIAGIAHWDESVLLNMRDFAYQTHITVVDISEEYGTQSPNTERIRHVIALQIRNNIPIRALFNLDYWRTAYYDMRRCVWNEETFTYRALLHPTRMGIATPDIHLRVPEAVLEFPHLVPVMVVLLRRSEAVHYAEQLCQQLQVVYKPFINYDELCGALQEQLSVVSEIIHEAEKLPLAAADGMVLRTRYPSLVRLKLSERYADWEVWAEGLLLEELHEKSSSPTLILLDRLYQLFDPKPEEIS
jgi:hypothetical protein